MGQTIGDRPRNTYGARPRGESVMVCSPVSWPPFLHIHCKLLHLSWSSTFRQANIATRVESRQESPSSVPAPWHCCEPSRRGGSRSGSRVSSFTHGTTPLSILGRADGTCIQTADSCCATMAVTSLNRPVRLHNICSSGSTRCAGIKACGGVWADQANRRLHQRVVGGR